MEPRAEGTTFLRERKQKIKNEPALKKKFVETIKAESPNIDTEEPIDFEI